MFNLDRAIADWRRRAAAGGINSPGVLDELESHLRDDIEEQTGRGVDTREAFDSAILRIGKVKPLRAEFAKSTRARGHGRRRFARGVCFGSAAFVLLANTWSVIALGLGTLELLGGLTVVAAVAAYLASLPFLDQWLSRPAHARIMGGIKVAAVFVPLVPIWASLTAAHVIHLEIGFIATLILWLALAATAITVLVCGWTGDLKWNWGSGGPLPPFSFVRQPVPPPKPRPPIFAAAIPFRDQNAPGAEACLTAGREREDWRQCHPKPWLRQPRSS